MYKRIFVSGKVKILTGGSKIILKPASGVKSADSVKFRSQRSKSGWKKRRPTMGTLNNSQHSTDANSSNYWSTKRIAQYALFVCLVAGFAYGPAAAAIVSILGFAPHLFTNPLGTIMAVLVSFGFSVTAAFIYKKMRTKKGAALSLILGSVVAIIIAIVGNLIITPLYAPHMHVADVASLILPVLLPFNIIKLALHVVITIIIYKPISKLLHKVN